MKVICKLQKLMADKGINQLQLAETTGLSPTTVGKLYRNQFEVIFEEDDFEEHDFKDKEKAEPKIETGGRLRRVKKL